MERERWRLTVVFTMPTAVELSQWIGVGGWGCPISSSVSLNIVACLQLRNRALSSALAAEATMKHKMAHKVKNAPFNLMGLVGLARQHMKKWPQALLWALASDRYDTSE
jgi:hypothetical protein